MAQAARQSKLPPSFSSESPPCPRRPCDFAQRVELRSSVLLLKIRRQVLRIRLAIARMCTSAEFRWKVCALFEFAAVADWDGPALGRSFDLRSWTKQPHEKYEISLPAAIRGKDVFPGDEPAGEGIADAQAIQTDKTTCRRSNKLGPLSYHQGSWTVSFHDASRCGARRRLTRPQCRSCRHRCMP